MCGYPIIKALPGAREGAGGDLILYMLRRWILRPSGIFLTILKIQIIVAQTFSDAVTAMSLQTCSHAFGTDLRRIPEAPDSALCLLHAPGALL